MVAKHRNGLRQEMADKVALRAVNHGCVENEKLNDLRRMIEDHFTDDALPNIFTAGTCLFCGEEVERVWDVLQ